MKQRRRSIKSLLAERVRALARKVTDTNVYPSAGEMEELKTLVTLAEVDDVRWTDKWKRVWQPLGVLVLFLLIGLSVALLLAKGPDTTEIDLESRLTGLSFTVKQPQQIFENVSLSWLIVGGVRCLSQRLSIVDVCQPQESLDQVSFEAVGRNEARPSLAISSLSVPARSTVTIEKSLNDPSYYVTIQSHDATITLPIVVAVRNAAVHMVRGTRPSKEYVKDFMAPTLMRLLCGPRIKLTIVPRSGAAIVLGKSVEVGDIVLSEDRERYEQREHSVRILSSVLAGSIFLDALDGKRIELRRYDTLRFTSPKGGTIRSLSADRNAEGTALLLRYHGDVGGMTRGASSQSSTLMPSWLELLMDNRALSLGRTAVIIIMTAALAALTILGIRK